MPDFQLEQSLGHCVVGVDEVGRGPWAGPVMAAAVWIDRQIAQPSFLYHLQDSKKLTAKKRDYLADAITQKEQPGFVWALGEASVEEIDQVNILEATKLAMHRALEQLGYLSIEAALVDGTVKLSRSYPTLPVIRGDQLSYSIAAASIIAKVTRDRFMGQLHQDFPHYGWDRNAGYGTKAHQEGLRHHGVCCHHRRSFAPIARQLVGS